MNTDRIHTGIKIVGICLIVALVGAAGVAIAQERARSTDPGSAPNAQSVERTVAYDSATPKGLPPDDNVKPGNARALSAPAVTFRYYQVAGATLRGRNSTTGFLYDGVGCSHVTAGIGTAGILNTELPLPDGAIIKYLRVYYRDTNAASGVQGYITRYNPGVATLDLVHTGSSAAFSGGVGFVVSTEITEVVNNTAYAYTLIGWPDEANVANQICGLRVAYYAPTALTFLPTVIKQ